jgi:hypothetical protein
MKEHHIQQNNSLARKVLEHIDKQDIAPRSRWKFRIQNNVFWLLWAISVIVGAGAVAASIFIFANVGWGFYDTTHESFLGFVFDSLPYVWISILIILIFIAYENIRFTTSGYRYPFFAIIILSVCVSGVGGVVLYGFGLGKVFDQTAGENIPYYRTINAYQQKIWVKPTRGLLAGTIDEIGNNAESFKLTAFDGTKWVVVGSELNDLDREVISDYKMVRIVGLPVASSLEKGTTDVFQACFVFPWDEYETHEEAILVTNSVNLVLGEIKETVGRSNKCRDVRPYKSLQSLQEIRNIK